ncbi:MAG: hypothetical protein NTU73_01715 [Ignavibacteriae bacterium]|nr:hypothetical protein [Ignavibacteriota bacterium]
MKKLLSISLIFLIAFNAGGYFFIYSQLENHFKQIAFNKVNEFIPLEKLEKIELNNKSVSSEAMKNFKAIDDKEILYNGKMYDIYKVEYQNEITILYCVNDENEDIIHCAFTEYLNEKNNDNDVKAVTNIIKILITLALEPNQTDFNPIQSRNDILFSYNILLQKIKIDIPSPPPKTIS